MIDSVSPAILPPLDPQFVPAALWNDQYDALAEQDTGKRPFALALVRDGKTIDLVEGHLLAASEINEPLTTRYLERLIKFLLWQKGAPQVCLAGADEVVPTLANNYSSTGNRAFDHQFMGQTAYGCPFSIEAINRDAIAPVTKDPISLGRHLDGCRIGFDLGGSDRKAAALIDGKVVFSEEIEWDPYFNTDPAYHFDGICDSLQRAASHLPRVDAIGGSAAGVYIDNEVRAGSLYRGISADDFQKNIVHLFSRVMEACGWADKPWQVINDGEVTALAGSMSLQAHSVLGVSMGTSEAAGYVGPHGNIRPWLNELAFAPIDYSATAPADEWSGDRGCGVQYFSQQAVARLAPLAGFQFDPSLKFPEILKSVQEAMTQSDPRAVQIYETIGVYFGYALIHYARFYPIEHVLILGRVTSGAGGELILEHAAKVLAKESPELASSIQLSTPNEKDKRHGQAIAAASLPPSTR